MKRDALEESSNLDLLRSIAIACVLLSHGLMLFGVEEKHLHLGALGFAGVLMFFVHTSLVLMMSLARQHARDAGTGLFRGFVLRRALRIYPLSVTAVLVSWLLAVGHFVPERPLRPSFLLANLALVQNVTGAPSRPGPLWTLPFEMQMYLAFPALYLLAWRQRRIGLWLLVWVVLVATIWFVPRLGVNADLVQFVPCFLPGIIAYMRRDVRPTLPAPLLPCALIAFAIVYSVLVARGASEEILGPSLCLLLGLLLPHVKELSSGPLARGVRIVATYSYGLYLVHGDLMTVIATRGAAWPVALRVVLLSAALVSLSILAYHAIERPGILLGAALERRSVTGHGSRR